MVTLKMNINKFKPSIRTIVDLFLELCPQHTGTMIVVLQEQHDRVVEFAARSDPDNLPLTDEQLQRLKRKKGLMRRLGQEVYSTIVRYFAPVVAVYDEVVKRLKEL